MTFAQFKKLFKEAQNETSNQMIPDALMRTVWRKIRKCIGYQEGLIDGKIIARAELGIDDFDKSKAIMVTPKRRKKK